MKTSRMLQIFRLTLIVVGFYMFFAWSDDFVIMGYGWVPIITLALTLVTAGLFIIKLRHSLVKEKYK